MIVCICTCILLRNGTSMRVDLSPIKYNKYITCWFWYTCISVGLLHVCTKTEWIVSTSKKLCGNTSAHRFPEVYENLGRFPNWWHHGRLENLSILLVVRDYEIETQFYEMKLGGPPMVFITKTRGSRDIRERWLLGFKNWKTQMNFHQTWNNLKQCAQILTAGDSLIDMLICYIINLFIYIYS